MKVLLIDAFDSFVYMIAQYYEKLGAFTKVVRSNENPIEVLKSWKPDLLVLGPGPGIPKDHGYLEILNEVTEEQSVFGVCLGHQAIGEFFGWKLVHAPSIEHGKKFGITHDSEGIFANIENPTIVVRYHSLVIENSENVEDLKVSAYVKSIGQQKVVMGVRHISRPIEGIQFHPESIGTKFGIKMIQNSLNAKCNVQ